MAPTGFLSQLKQNLSSSSTSSTPSSRSSASTFVPIQAPFYIRLSESIETLIRTSIKFGGSLLPAKAPLVAFSKKVLYIVANVICIGMPVYYDDVVRDESEDGDRCIRSLSESALEHLKKDWEVIRTANVFYVTITLPAFMYIKYTSFAMQTISQDILLVSIVLSIMSNFSAFVLNSLSKLRSRNERLGTILPFLFAIPAILLFWAVLCLIGAGGVYAIQDIAGQPSNTSPVIIIVCIVIVAVVLGSLGLLACLSFPDPQRERQSACSGGCP